MQGIKRYEDLAEPQDTAALLSQTAMLKLNGGLGTSMGLEKAKSLLVVKDGKTFLDLIAEQVRRLLDSLLRRRVPLRGCVARPHCTIRRAADSHSAV